MCEAVCATQASYTRFSKGTQHFYILFMCIGLMFCPKGSKLKVRTTNMNMNMHFVKIIFKKNRVHK